MVQDKFTMLSRRNDLFRLGILAKYFLAQILDANYISVHKHTDTNVFTHKQTQIYMHAHIYMYLFVVKLIT